MNISDAGVQTVFLQTEETNVLIFTDIIERETERQTETETNRERETETDRQREISQ